MSARRPSAWLVLSAVVVALVWVVWPQPTPSEGDVLEAAHVEEGDGPMRIILTQDAASRIDLRTATVEQDGDAVVVPDSALMWDGGGTAIVYEEVDDLTYSPVTVELDHQNDGRAWLVSGPEAGAVVVSLGAAELYGVQHGIGH